MQNIIDPVLERLPNELQSDLANFGKVMPLRHGKSGRKGFRVTLYNKYNIESIKAALSYYGYELVSHTEHESEDTHFINIHIIKEKENE